MNLLARFLKYSLPLFESAACVTSEGEVIGLKYESVVDIGTLGQAGSTAVKYFSPGMGDVILLNDPYSGGSLLSMLTLVTPLCLGQKNIPDLYFVLRTGFRAQLSLSSKLDEEGLRIPPTPIASGRVLNTMILSAIQENPHAPGELKDRLESVLETAWDLIDHFASLIHHRPASLKEADVTEILDRSKLLFSHVLSEFPTGESRTETRLDSGELIRLRLSLSPQTINFDFSGTSASKRICMTDSATFGACFGGLSAFLQKSVPMNSGSFSLLHVTSPLGCLLNAKFPSPTFRGMTEGSAQVAGTVVKTLGEIMPQRRVSLSAQAPVQIGLKFPNGKRFFDTVAGGSGASAGMAGEDGVLLWVRNSLRNSVQEIESRFPLRVNGISLRTGSGGVGLFNGGNGLIKSYTVQMDCELSWLLPSKLAPFLGQAGGSSGLPPELEIQRINGSIDLLASEEGSIELFAGDTLSVKSPGGGGFGAQK